MKDSHKKVSQDPAAPREGASAGTRPGLRLIKSAPEEIIADITAGGIDARAEAIARAKAHPLVKQLTCLADALEAEVAMIMKM